MTVHPLSLTPSNEQASALARFEAQFTYPLGPERTFSISHGHDYARFFRAMGDNACFIAEREGEILGTISASIVSMLAPTGHEQALAYIGDLKIAPHARGSRALFKLIQAMRQWVEARAETAFSIVMDGTKTTPPQYSGRIGVPPFRELAKVTVIRFNGAPCDGSTRAVVRASAERGVACFRHLTTGRYAALGGDPNERSEMAPLWLIAGDGSACGRLEDTRRAKRLHADDGSEMRGAHVSCFAFSDPCAGADLLRVARSVAYSSGLPSLFTSVTTPDTAALCRLADFSEATLAPATIYGTGIDPFPSWNINTAEI